MSIFVRKIFEIYREIKGAKESSISYMSNKHNIKSSQAKCNLISSRRVL